MQRHQNMTLEYITGQLELYQNAALTLTGSITHGGLSIYGQDREQIKSNLIEGGIGYSEEMLDWLVHADKRMNIDFFKELLQFLTRTNYSPSLPNYEEYLRPSSSTEPFGDRGKLLSECWIEYVQDKRESGRWSKESDIREREAEFKDFLEIIGGNRNCHAVSKDEAKQFRVALTSYPKNRKKLHGNKNLADIPENAERISLSTAKQRLNHIKGFFEYLLKEDVITQSPFTNIDIIGDKKNYATYTSIDIKELFNLHPKYIKKAWQFWIPRIAIYTGARQDEIAQLTVKDIIYDKESEIWYLSINDIDKKSVKSKAAIRRVPIHSKLIEHGFIKFFQETNSRRQSESLWADLQPKAGKLGQTVSRYWTDLKEKKCQLTDKVDHQGRKKVFHSLRRVTINHLKKANVEIEVIQLLVGHETELGATGIYLDGVDKPLPILKEAIEKLDIENVGWSQQH